MSIARSIHPQRCAGILVFVFALFISIIPVYALDSSVPLYSPAINGEALRGLSSIGSAESMGAGRITFDFFTPWYKQQSGFLTTPNAGAHILTIAGAFSYGVNSSVDIFASIAGYSSTNYINTNKSYGLGTIRAGVQGSLPFPQHAYIRMGGQAAILGGTSRNQINTFRADGYNYFETRTRYTVLGKLMQTVRFGGVDRGIKMHFNEAGVIGIRRNEYTLLLLGSGLQANIGFIALGAEINSRTRFNDMAFGTDPLWVTPSIHLRTPYQMSFMGGVDLSISSDRSANLPRALEPYRVFGALSFSFDMMASRRLAALKKKRSDDAAKAALELSAENSAQQVESYILQSATDSIALVKEREASRNTVDSLQTLAVNKALDNKNAALVLSTKATEDSLSLVRTTDNLAREREKRSDAENMLLGTGQLILDAVYFQINGTAISINSKPYLNFIASILLKYPRLQIEVAGYTDNIGTKEYNTTLSQKRANAVQQYLVEVEPQLRYNLDAYGYGMLQPRADNNTSDGRMKNRRVELHVTNTEELLEYSQMNE